MTVGLPGLSNAGSDPNGSTDITGSNKNPARTAPDDDDSEFLAGLAALHQSIIDKINNWPLTFGFVVVGVTRRH